jgi:tight adherence protein B
VTGLVALLVGGLVFAAAFLLLTMRRRFATQQLDWYSGPSPRSSQKSRPGPTSIVQTVEDALARLDGSGRLKQGLDRAGVDRSPGAFVLFVLLIALTLFVLVSIVLNATVGLIVAISAPFVSMLVLTTRARKRSREFELQLPEVLDSLSASLKAGHGFEHALQTMSTEVGEPAGSEFRRVVAETHLGRQFDTALRELGDRVQSEDLVFVLDAISIQRQVGGSLAELFELVSETVREREQFRRKVRAITGMVRASATVLMLLPLAAALGLTLVNHSYEAPLFTTTMGQAMCALTIAMMVIGGVILRRIGSVKP